MANDNNVAFARKYRPTSLRGYVGNAGIKETVQRYLKNGRPQTVLLTGSSGCGKTTLARIIAKEYLCEDRDDENGACCQCGTCLSIDEYISTGSTGDLPDIYEIDASDDSSKKDMDALLSSIEYPPVAGDWKVYIIDEVHLLSEGAMGRLLKSVEEPPEYVLFIFCTTDPERLLPTIRNRCQLKLNITKPSTSDIVELLKTVCLQEDKPYSVQGLRMIAARSDNVIRDSLNNIERVLATRGSATDVSVSEEFQEVSDKLIFDFYKSFLAKDYMGYMSVMYTVKVSYTFEQFLRALTNFTKRGIYILNGIEVEGVAPDELTSYLKLFKSISPEEISFILSSLKKMNVGDIEANFLSFVYLESISVTEEKSTSVAISAVPSVNSERAFRNENLKKIESAKLEKGSASLSSQSGAVGFEDLGEFFTLEKVSKD